MRGPKKNMEKGSGRPGCLATGPNWEKFRIVHLLGSIGLLEVADIVTVVPSKLVVLLAGSDLMRGEGSNRMVQTSASFRHESQDFDSSLSLSEVISALSFAMDLTEGVVHGHALRSCLLGMRIAQELRLSGEDKDNLYYALLLKNVGCTGDLGELDWPQRGATLGWTANGAPYDRGAAIITKLGAGPRVVEAIRRCDDRWDGAGLHAHGKGNEIPLLARVCAVAQHLDSSAVLHGEEVAMRMLEQRSGTWLDPELVLAARALDRNGALWLHCHADENDVETRQAVLDFDPGRSHSLNAEQIDQVCESFADVVDMKSHFTFRHSLGVAKAAHGIAIKLGLAADRVKLVRRAALLHDIGKLSVSNAILHKRGWLNPDEWRVVRQHPGMTRQILERIRSFREIAIVAGEHHEKLDGSGYPNRLMAKDLSIESRIIAVADVYGALSEDRPYRPGMEYGKIAAILGKLTPHKLDAECVMALRELVAEEPFVGFEPLATAMTQACA